MHAIDGLLLFSALLALCTVRAPAGRSVAPRWRVLVRVENGGHHIAYSQRARIWLDQLAADNGFDVDYIQNVDTLDDALLSRYALFIQLDYPPYGWNPQASAAFERYISE